VIIAPDAVYQALRGVIDKLDARRAQVFVEALIVEIATSSAASRRSSPSSSRSSSSRWGDRARDRARHPAADLRAEPDHPLASAAQVPS
jgi:hypothetical protein